MTMKVRVLLAATIIAVTLASVGCGHYTCGTNFGASSCTPSGSGINGNGNGSGSGTFLLIADAGGIVQEKLNASAGTLTATAVSEQVPTQVPGDWMALAQAKYMYTAYTALGSLYGWTVAGDGTLTAISGTPLSTTYLLANTSAGSQAVITNPAGTLLFVTDHLNEKIYVYQIGTGGVLTVANNSPLQLPAGFNPYNLATDGLGLYLYVSNLVGSNTNEVAAYSIGSDGTLTAVTGSPMTLAIQQMQGESTGKYMVGIQSNLVTGDSHVYVMTVQSGGLLSAAVPTTTASSPNALAVQPGAGGNLVYTFPFSSGVSGSIEGYTLNTSNGGLTIIGGSPFQQAFGVYGQFDQKGDYLFVIEDTTTLHTTMDAFAVSTPALTTPVASVGWNAGAWQAVETQ